MIKHDAEWFLSDMSAGFVKPLRDLLGAGALELKEKVTPLGLCSARSLQRGGVGGKGPNVARVGGGRW